MSDKKPLKETLKEALDSALGSVWEDVCEEFQRDTYAELGGYDKAELRIINGTIGVEWWHQTLAELTDGFLEIRDGSAGAEEAEWCDAVAADFEAQAARIRAHAAELRGQNAKGMARGAPESPLK